MKTSAVAVLVLVSLAAGALGHQLLRSPDSRPSIDYQSGTTFQPETGLEARIGGLGQRLDDLSAHIDKLQAQSASDWKLALELLSKLNARASSAESKVAVVPPGGPSVTPTEEGAEALRVRWRQSLDTAESITLQQDPAGWNSKDENTVGRLDDQKKARAALESANDLAALRKLAEGQFSFYFKLGKGP